MLRSKALIENLIETELAVGLEPNRIILGGFSQGAAMSLLTGLSLEKKLAGLVCLSGWVPIKTKLESVRSFLSCTKIPLLTYMLVSRFSLRMRLKFPSSGAMARPIRWSSLCSPKNLLLSSNHSVYQKQRLMRWLVFRTMFIQGSVIVPICRSWMI